MFKNCGEDQIESTKQDKIWGYIEVIGKLCGISLLNPMEHAFQMVTKTELDMEPERKDCDSGGITSHHMININQEDLMLHLEEWHIFNNFKLENISECRSIDFVDLSITYPVDVEQSAELPNEKNIDQFLER